jgi:hypothetical protein
MKRSIITASCLAALGLMVSLGCEKAPDPADNTLAPTTPEGKFELIAQTFRRGMEIDASEVIAVGKSNQQAAISITNRVSHKLIPPASEGDIYRGTITVESQSHYAIQRIEPTQEQAGGEQATGEESTTTEGGTEAGVEIRDTDLMGTAANTSRPQKPARAPAKAMLPGRPDLDVRNYELEYRNGRWELVTKIDLETDLAVQKVFEHALKTQL